MRNYADDLNDNKLVSKRTSEKFILKATDGSSRLRLVVIGCKPTDGMIVQ